MTSGNRTRTFLRSAGALLPAACAAAVVVALTLGWGVNTDKQLIRFANSNGGAVEIIDEQVVSYSVTDKPVSQIQLKQLRLFPRLKSLELDVSRCLPEQVTVLSELPELESISLTGSVPQMWPRLMELPNISRVSLVYDRLEAYPAGDPEFENMLAISQKRLTVREAEAINAISDLEFLSLNVRTAERGVWETFAENRSLKSLSIRINVPRVDALVSRRDFISLAAIPTLKDILLFDSVRRKGNAHGCVRHSADFKKLRRDVEVVLAPRRLPGRQAIPENPFAEEFPGDVIIWRLDAPPAAPQ